MKNLILLLLLLVLPISLLAAPGDIMVGSRGYGMGGAYTAVVDDASAAYWNPAALSRVESIQLLVSHWILQDIDGLNATYASAAFPIPKVGTFSGSWLMQHADLESGYDPSTGGAASTSSFNENTFTISYGRELFDSLAFFRKTSVGVSLNRYAIMADDEDDEGTGVGFDFSMNIGFPANINLAFMARNIASDLMGEKIDPELRWGLGYNSPIIRGLHKITVDFDAAMKFNRDYSDISTLEYQEKFWKFYAGGEYGILFNNMEIQLRGGAGWAANQTIKSVNYSFGGGFKLHGQGIQYAYGNSSESTYSLGANHRISIVLDIGRMVEGKKSSTDVE